jgi:hypothetical protein
MNNRSVASHVTAPLLQFDHLMYRHMQRYKLFIIIILIM